MKQCNSLTFSILIMYETTREYYNIYTLYTEQEVIPLWTVRINFTFKFINYINTCNTGQQLN